MRVGIGGGSLPFGYVDPRQDVQVTTSTLGTTDDMWRVITLAGEHGIIATTTECPLKHVNQALGDLAEHTIVERALLIL